MPTGWAFINTTKPEQASEVLRNPYKGPVPRWNISEKAEVVTSGGTSVNVSVPNLERSGSHEIIISVTVTTPNTNQISVSVTNTTTNEVLDTFNLSGGGTVSTTSASNTSYGGQNINVSVSGTSSATTVVYMKHTLLGSKPFLFI